MPNWEIWNAGLPIEAAVVAGTDRNLLQTYLEAVKKEINRNPGAGNISLDFWQSLLECAKLPFRSSVYSSRRCRYPNPHIDTNDGWQKDVLTLFQKEIALTIGFVEQRQIDQSPEIIPRDVWFDHINWEKGEVRGNGLSFVGVRIVSYLNSSDRLKIASKAQVAHPSLRKESESVSNPAGRPSRQQQIIEAFYTLHKEGRLDFSMPMKASYPIIRNWIREHFPDDDQGDRGLSDKTLAREINPLILQYVKTAEN